MTILDVVEFFDDSGEIIVTKIPQEGSGEFRLGSQLVVQESQSAVFYRDGRALDMFLPGRYTLETQNLPLLTSLIAIPFGGRSPFRCYVYFIATKTFVNLGWGTATPVMFRDSELRMVSLRAHGMYSIRITKPRTFLQTLVGTRGMETTYAVEDFFRTAIVSRLNETMAATLKSILDLPTHYRNIALGVKQAVAADFEQYGVQLVDLLVEAITVPQEVQKMLNRATGVAAQDAEKYRAVAAADAMRDAAKNPGTAGEGIGAGVGMGMGFGLAREFAGGMRGGPSPQSASETGTASLSSSQVREKLMDLKEMKDDGLISDADFEEQKRKLLQQF